MRRLLLLALMALCAPVIGHAQSMGFIAPQVREVLARAWDDTNPRQVERGLCVHFRLAALPDSTPGNIYLVTQLTRPDSAIADQYNSSFVCPMWDPFTTMLHTHPPATCDSDKKDVPIPSTCVIGGGDAYNCSPSPEDVSAMVFYRKPFALVQCDRNSVVFYFNPRVEVEFLRRADSVRLTQKYEHRERVGFYTGMGAAFLTTVVLRPDRDPGGYRDGWGTHATFPDKLVHGVTAFALTEVGADLKVQPWVAASVVCATGVGFEFTQGYVSGYDIAANCIGATASAVWRSWHP